MTAPKVQTRSAERRARGSDASASTTDHGLLYIGTTRSDPTERHLSLVPYFHGMEAVCGHLVGGTRAVPSHAAVAATTCQTCRGSGMKIV